MTETIKTSKYKYLNDPPVISSPFSITVDEDKCIGCGVCVMQCPCQTIQMIPRQTPSEKQEAACQLTSLSTNPLTQMIWSRRWQPYWPVNRHDSNDGI